MNKLKLGRLTIERVVESIGMHKPNFLFPELNINLLDIEKDWLIPNFVDRKTNDLIMSFHSYVIKSKNFNILVDTCVGNDKDRSKRPFWHKLNTPYLQKLKKIKLNPEDIDYVMCTHLHADHVGWNTRLINNEWVPTFPNAKYIFSKKEYDFWLDMINKDKTLNHGSFQDSVLPIINKGNYKLVEEGHCIDDFLAFESAPGHTPGNMVINVKSENDSAVLCGDTIHHAIQLSFPNLSSRFCEDPKLASETRIKLLNKLSDSNTFLLPAHFPKIGKVIKKNEKFYLKN